MKGRFRVKRTTSRKKFVKKCKELNQKIKSLRLLKVSEIIKRLNSILEGYYRYYGITDNSKSLYRMYHNVRRMLFYWLNRRSQKRSYTWEGFKEVLRYYPLALPKIYVYVLET